MRRFLLATILVSTATGVSVGQAPRPDVPAPLRPDPDYRPAAGDHAVVLMDHVPAATSRSMLDGYVRAQDRGDTATMDRETSAGNVLKLARGVRLDLVTVHAPPRIIPSDSLRGLSIGEFERGRREALARDGVHAAGYPVEARVLDGPHAGKVVFVEKRYVGQWATVKVAVPPPVADFRNPPRRKVRPAPRSMPARPASPEDRAAASLQLGKNLRFDGKRQAAVEYFRKAIGQAPGSPAAAEARSNLKEMGVE